MLGISALCLPPRGRQPDHRHRHARGRDRGAAAGADGRGRVLLPRGRQRLLRARRHAGNVLPGDLPADHQCRCGVLRREGSFRTATATRRRNGLRQADAVHTAPAPTIGGPCATDTFAPARRSRRRASSTTRRVDPVRREPGDTRRAGRGGVAAVVPPADDGASADGSRTSSGGWPEARPSCTTVRTTTTTSITPSRPFPRVSALGSLLVCAQGSRGTGTGGGAPRGSEEPGPCVLTTRADRSRGWMENDEDPGSMNRGRRRLSQLRVSEGGLTPTSVNRT